MTLSIDCNLLNSVINRPIFFTSSTAKSIEGKQNFDSNLKPPTNICGDNFESLASELEALQLPPYMYNWYLDIAYCLWDASLFAQRTTLMKV